MLMPAKIKELWCTENILGIFIIAMMVLVLFPLAPKPNREVSGILLPSMVQKAIQPVSADQVAVLDVMPPSAQNLGLIHTKIYFASMDREANDHNMKVSLAKAKQLAGGAGANAIVINEVGLEGAGVSPLDGFVIHATAIHTQ